MTYSIVARDDKTGQLGVAVATAMFAVGAGVPWVRAGVGAVASQAMTEAAYGWRCLEALAQGDGARNSLDAAKALDPMAALRQVGVVDASGGIAAFTGELCIDHCGHTVGDGFAIQANMMANPQVWPDMAAAFEASRGTGSLARRMLATLRAAQAAGGDARGQVSAAMVVVDETRRDDQPWAGRLVDLRVERAMSPLDDLERLLDAAEAFDQLQRGIDALMAGEGAQALSSLDDGLARLPGEPSLRFPRAGALALQGRQDEALAELRGLIAERPTWRIVIEGFAAKGLLQLPDGVDL